MKIHSTEFIKSAVESKDYPDTGLPEIAFVGKSNVGKSSLINKLLNRKSLAKTSSTPGKTRLINFFLITAASPLVFVDLPGYGYAKVSKKERESWGPMMKRYFSKREQLKCVVFLQDLRRDQSESDKVLMEFFRDNNIPVILVYTKADKLSGNKRSNMARLMTKNAPDEKAPIFFSSLKGFGVEDLWDAIIGQIRCEINSDIGGNS